MIVVATEDTYIQKQYFDRFRGSRFEVRTLPTDLIDGKSSPAHVLERMKEWRRNNEVEDDDEFWISIDSDKWPVATLKAVFSEARRNGFQLVVSNPCFEYWLLVHLEEPTAEHADCSCVGARLRALSGGYSKQSLPPGLVTEANLRRAMDRGAAGCPIPPSTAWPTGNGTQVHFLARRLLDLGAELIEG